MHSRCSSHICIVQCLSVDNIFTTMCKTPKVGTRSPTKEHIHIHTTYLCCYSKLLFINNDNSPDLSKYCSIQLVNQLMSSTANAMINASISMLHNYTSLRNCVLPTLVIFGRSSDVKITRWPPNSAITTG